MKKLFTAVITFLLTSVLFANAMEAAKPTVKIGVVAGITGDFQIWGESARNALLLAKQQLPKNTKYKYELVIEDCQSSVPKSILAAKKLLSVDKADALISLFVEMGQVVSPVADKAGVVHIGIATDPEIAKGPNNFTLYVAVDEYANKMAEALEKRSIKKVALFVMKVAYCNNMQKKVEEVFQKKGIEIVSNISYNPDQRDFRTMIAQAKAKNPEEYILITFTPTLELLAKQLKEAGINNYTGFEDIENSDQLALFDEHWFLSQPNANSHFGDEYQRKYSSSYTVGAPNCYDAFNLIVQAYEKASKDPSRKPTAAEVSEQLKQMKGYQGALGELTCRPEKMFWVHAVEKMVSNGRVLAQPQN